jgi:hypothetical protein
MKKLIYIAIGGGIGWWLALNKKEETLKALAQAKEEVMDLKEELMATQKNSQNMQERLDDQVVNSNR